MLPKTASAGAIKVDEKFLKKSEASDGPFEKC